MPELRERFSIYEKTIPLSSPHDQESDFDAMWLIVLESFRRRVDSKNKMKALTAHLRLAERAVRVGTKHGILSHEKRAQFLEMSKQIILDCDAATAMIRS
jgi:hypothetical protein